MFLSLEMGLYQQRTDVAREAQRPDDRALGKWQHQVRERATGEIGRKPADSARKPIEERASRSRWLVESHAAERLCKMKIEI